MNDDNDTSNLPPGWRPEWRAPKAKRGRGAAPPLDPSTPLPSTQEMGEIARRVLLAVAQDSEAGDTARVTAAKTLCEIAADEAATAEAKAKAEACRARFIALCEADGIDP
jgi:hypothetical protein